MDFICHNSPHLDDAISSLTQFLNQHQTPCVSKELKERIIKLSQGIKIYGHHEQQLLIEKAQSLTIVGERYANFDKELETVLTGLPALEIISTLHDYHEKKERIKQVLNHNQHNPFHVETITQTLRNQSPRPDSFKNEDLRSKGTINKPIRPSESQYNPKDIPKIMGHFFGDSFAQNSYLEGSSSNMMGQFLEASLHRNKQVLSDTATLDEILNAVQKGNLLRPSIETLCKSTDDVEETIREFKDDFCQALHQLEDSDSIIMKFGWGGGPGEIGHATYLQIIKEPAPSSYYTVRHFNLGAGSDIYQDSLYRNEKQQQCYFPYTLQRGVSLESLTQTSFLLGFRELLQSHHTPQKFGPRDLYTVLNLLGPMSKETEIHESDFQEIQHSGLCGWHSLNAILKHNLSEEDYAHLYLAMGEDLITSFKDDLTQEHGLLTLSNLDIYQQCIHSFLDQTATFNGFYTHQENLIIEHVRDILSFVSEKYDQIINDTIDPFHGKIMLTSQSVTTPLSELTTIDIQSTEVVSFTPKVIDFPQLDTVQDITLFLENAVSECVAQFSTNKTEEGYKRVLNLANMTIQHLPPPGDERWNEIRDEQVIHQLHMLADLMTRCFILDEEINLDHRKQVDTLLSQYQVMGITLAIIDNRTQTATEDESYKSVVQWAQSINTRQLYEDVFSSQFGGESNLYSIKHIKLHRSLKIFFDTFDSRPSNQNVRGGGDLSTYPIKKSDLQGNPKNSTFITLLQTYSDRNPGEYSLSDLFDEDTQDFKSSIPIEFSSFYAQLKRIDAIKLGHFERKDSHSFDIHDLTRPVSRYTIQDNGELEEIKVNLITSLCYGTHKFLEGNKKHPFDGLSDTTLQETLSIRKLDFKNRIEDLTFKNPITTNIRLPESSLNLREIIELSSFFSRSERSEKLSGLSLVKLLDYFHENSHLLRDHSNRRNYQHFFKIHLLSDALDEEQLDLYNQLKPHIQSFLDEGFQRCIQEKNLESACFFVKLMIFLEPRLNDHTEIQETLSFYCLDKLKEIDDHDHCSHDIRTLVHQLKIVHYFQNDTLDDSPEAIYDYLDAIVKQNRPLFTHDLHDPEVTLLCEKAFTKFAPIVESHLSEATSLQQYVAPLFPDTQTEWLRTSPGIYVSEDITFNLNLGTITKGSFGKGIPEELRVNETFNQLFSGIDLTEVSFSRDGSSYEIPWGEGTLRFQQNEENAFDVFLKKKGPTKKSPVTWYKLITLSEMEKDATVSKSLLNDRYVFIQQHLDTQINEIKKRYTLDIDDSEKKVFLDTLIEKLERGDTIVFDHKDIMILDSLDPTQFKTILEKLHDSKSVLPNVFKKAKAHPIAGNFRVILDKLKHSLYMSGLNQHAFPDNAIIFIDKHTKVITEEGTIASLEKRKQNEELLIRFGSIKHLETGHHYLSAKHSPLQQLYQIEAPSSVECLGDPETKKCSQINLLSLGITLKRNLDTDIFECTSPPELIGFHVEEQQYARQLNGFKGFLRLRNDETSILIVPSKKITPLGSDEAEILSHIPITDAMQVRFGSQYKFDHNGLINDTLKPFYLIDPRQVEFSDFQSTPIRQKKEDHEQTAFLLYLFSAIEDYDHTLHLTHRFLTNPLPPTEKEVTLFSAHLKTINKNDPRGAALFLYIYNHLNERSTPEQWASIQSELKQHVTPTFQIYAELLPKGSRFALPESIEKKLLLDIQHDTPELVDLPLVIQKRIETKSEDFRPSHQTQFESGYDPTLDFNLDLFKDELKELSSTFFLIDYSTPLPLRPTRILRDLFSPILWCYKVFKEPLNTEDIELASDILSTLTAMNPKSTIIRLLHGLRNSPDVFMSFDDFIKNLRKSHKAFHNDTEGVVPFSVALHRSIQEATEHTTFDPQESTHLEDIRVEISSEKKAIPPGEDDYSSSLSQLFNEPLDLNLPENKHRFPVSRATMKTLLLKVKQSVEQVQPITGKGHLEPPVHDSELLSENIQTLQDDLDHYVAQKNKKTHQLIATLSHFIGEHSHTVENISEKQTDTLIRRLKVEFVVSKQTYEKMKLNHALQACHLATYGTIEEAEKNHRQKQVSIDELSLAFIEGTTTAYQALNSTLTEEDCQKLHEHVFNFIQCSRKSNQLSRVHRLCDTLLQYDEDHQHLIPDCIQEMFDELNMSFETTPDGLHTTIRYNDLYPLNQHRDIMVFEHKTGFGLRPLQLQNMGILGDSSPQNEKVAQMIMGSGKTQVLLPLLAKKKADGKKLSCIVVPDALLNDVVEDLHTKSSDIFHQKPVVFTFDRNTTLSQHELDRLIKTFESIISDRDYMITTSKSVHCLRLRFMETIMHYQQLKETLTEDTDQHRERIQETYNTATKLQTLLKILHDKGDVTIDEADMLLNCKNEFNFTVGMDVAPPEEELSFLVSLHRLTKEARTELTAKKEVTKETFKERLKEKLLSKLFDTPSYFDSSVAEFLHKHHDLVRSFLVSQENLPDNVIPEVMESILYLLRHELDELLSITCQKEVFVGFGPDLTGKCYSAIPYVGNNKPSVSSRFDQIHELLNYTIQMYQDIPMPEHILRDHLAQLHRDYKKEQSHGIPFHDSVAIAQLSELFPGVTTDYLKSDTTIDTLIEEIQTLFQNQPDVLDNYLKKYLLKFISTNDQSLNSNSFDLVSLFGRVQAFSGTLWNKDTFHQRLETLVEVGTDGESLSVLLNRDTPIQTLSEEESTSPLSMIDTLSISHKTCAFIDCGPLFKGVSNRKIAEALLEKVSRENPSIHAIVFYEDNTKKVLRHMDGELIIELLSESDIGLNERFTYYDHSHSTGSDIKQPDEGEAITSVGINLKTRDLFQGIWRMRGLSKTQRIKLLVSPEVATNIGSPTPTMNDILTFVSKNQADQLEEQLIQSAQTQFSHVFTLREYERLLEQDISTLDKETMDQFVKRKTIKAKDLYRRTKQKVTRDETLKTFQADLEQQLNEPLSESIQSQIDRAIELGEKRLPQQFMFPSNPEGTQVEALAEVEKEVENEIEQEVVQEVMDSYTVPDREGIFGYGDLLSSELWHEILTVQDHEVPFCVQSLSSVDDNFSKDLLISKNLMSDSLRDKFRGESSHPLKDPFQLNCHHVLVLGSKIGPPKRMIMLHEYDVKKILEGWKFRTLYSKDIGSPKFGFFSISRGAPTAFHLDPDDSSISPNWIMEDPELKELLVQVKFFNGVITYSRSEYESLSNWFKKADKDKLRTQFETDILRNTPENQPLFKESKLYKLLST